FGVCAFPGTVQSCWGIDNSLHYGLDVTFREDECRIRKGRRLRILLCYGVLLEIILKYIEIKRNFTYSGVHNIKKVAKVKNARSYPFKTQSKCRTENIGL
ncbi:MAG: transposase, partial [Desulfobulbaceae bacterium]|nr:transposase [Desulfobulbaceae bacterium]